MGKGRGPCLTSCDHVLIAFIVLAATSILVIGLLDGFHVLPRSHFREYDCQVKGVETILSRCLECTENLEDYDNTEGRETGAGGHHMPEDPDVDGEGPDMDGTGNEHMEPDMQDPRDRPEENPDMDGQDRGGRDRPSGGRGTHEESGTDSHTGTGGPRADRKPDMPEPDMDGMEEPGKIPPMEDKHGEGDKKPEGPEPRMDDMPDSPEHKGPEDGTGHMYPMDDKEREDLGGKDGMGQMKPDEPPMDGNPEEWFGKEREGLGGKDGMGQMKPDEPPIDGNPDEWFGKEREGRPEGGCPPVAALLIHVMYEKQKHAMLHGDHSSHQVQHSFADCDQDKLSDPIFPMEYDADWDPEPQNNPMPMPTEPVPDQGLPDDDMDPDLPDGPMGVGGDDPAKPDTKPRSPGSGPMEPAIEPDFAANDPIKRGMSGDMHALMTEFKTFHEAGQTFPCYVHAKNPEHAFYEAPYHHNYMGRFNNLSYPVMVTFVLLLVFTIKKICDAKSAKRVNDVVHRRFGEKYIVPDAVVTVPVATAPTKAAEAGCPEDEKNPTILGPEVVPGGIRVGSQTVMMQGPVSTGEKEAEAFGVATPRSMVSDPFPPVEPDYERVESPPPAYNNLTPRY